MADRYDDRFDDGLDDRFEDRYDDRDDDRFEGDDPDDAGLGVGAYRLARTRTEESIVRAAFSDLDARVRAEISPPPARAIAERARRRQVRTARRRVGLAAAAAAVLLGGAALVQSGLGRTDGTSVVATTSSPTSKPTTAGSTTAAPLTTNPQPVVTSSKPVRTRTVVVTVDPGASSRRPTSTRPRTSTRTAAPTKAGPKTEVTVFLWQGTLYPTCTNQYSVKRTIPGTGGWQDAVEAALDGTTSQERADGYVSPFGSGVVATVDEATHTVNFSSTSGFADVPPACRVSLEQLVERTAATAGHGATFELRGSTILWLNWRAGLL